jgi:hypothetical protein
MRLSGAHWRTEEEGAIQALELPLNDPWDPSHKTPVIPTVTPAMPIGFEATLQKEGDEVSEYAWKEQ